MLKINIVLIFFVIFFIFILLIIHTFLLFSATMTLDCEDAKGDIEVFQGDVTEAIFNRCCPGKNFNNLEIAPLTIQNRDDPLLNMSARGKYKRTDVKEQFFHERIRLLSKYVIWLLSRCETKGVTFPAVPREDQL